MAEHVDVLIIGAGLSGIGAAYHLQTRCRDKKYIILEGRDAIGGTWDLFRYPGVRSDSDMFTLGYSFRPWSEAKAIADGPAILKYIRDTATEFGIDKNIRLGHWVRSANWSSKDTLWTVEVEKRTTGEVALLTCNFLFVCSGYYDYEKGYTPDWKGIEQFKGCIVHPQKWPQDLDYSGKRIVIIGSGATAVTLAPAMTDKAAHVVMLQRSPSYVVSRPSEDKVAAWLIRHLPAKLAHSISRWLAALVALFFYIVMRKYPNSSKQKLVQLVQQELGSDYDVATHFTPQYNPWDQRVCFVPDSDLFNAIKSGKVTMVTDQIECFTEKGIQLRSGQHLEADIIVTATGLNIKFMGGAQVCVDGNPIQLSKMLVYKGMMLSNIPNFVFAVGYTNASWTLKVDLVSEYVCRLLNFMDRQGYKRCTPRNDTYHGDSEPILDFTSGYVQRAIDILPRQGAKVPWKLHQNYVLDVLTLRFGKVDDEAMEFST
jgi:monooxygenase